jgi:hypothetical protein
MSVRKLNEYLEYHERWEKIADVEDHGYDQYEQVFDEQENVVAFVTVIENFVSLNFTADLDELSQRLTFSIEDVDDLESALRDCQQIVVDTINRLNNV